jgi:hypothetical protein
MRALALAQLALLALPACGHHQPGTQGAPPQVDEVGGCFVEDPYRYCETGLLDDDTEITHSVCDHLHGEFVQSVCPLTGWTAKCLPTREHPARPIAVLYTVEHRDEFVAKCTAEGGRPALAR